MDLSLTGKRALVCGSTQGIGRAAAVELASLGAPVTRMARDEAKLKAVAAELPRGGHDFVAADFANPESVGAAIKPRASQTYHILVNNTGGPPGGQAVDAAPDAYLAAFKMHV